MNRPVDDLLLERYLAGECTQSERAAVEAWLDASPSGATFRSWESHRAALTQARDRWNTSDGWTRLQSELGSRPVLQLEPARQRHRIAAWSRPLAALAATLLVVAGGVAVMRVAGGGGAATGIVVAREASTGRGETREIRLDDSSVVTLGPESSIHYTLGATRRDVVLSGLADFRVAHDEKRAFVVRAGDVTTTDLGTEFVIRAYAADSTVAVAVSSGRVAVIVASEPGRSTDLGAGDVALRAPGAVLEVRRNTDLSRYTDWVQGRLAFENQTLREVAVELARWFDLDVRVADGTLARRRVTGVYDAPTATDVLDAISAGLGVRYERDGKVVTLYLLER